VLKYDSEDIMDIVSKIVENDIKDLFFVKKLLIYPTKYTEDYLMKLKLNKDLES
jgi:hypothetical protein